MRTPIFLTIYVCLIAFAPGCSKTSSGDDEGKTTLSEIRRLPVEISEDSSGRLYLAVNYLAYETVYTSNSDTETPIDFHAVVLESADQGDTWDTAFTGELPTGGQYRLFGNSSASMTYPFQIMSLEQSVVDDTVEVNWLRRDSSGAYENGGTLLSVEAGLGECTQVVPTTTGTLVALCYTKTSYAGSSRYMLKKSTDNGATWTTVLAELPEDCAATDRLHMTSTNQLLLYGGNVICSSTDTGTTVSLLKEVSVSEYREPVITNVSSFGATIFAHYYAISSLDVLYGYIKTTDSGANWTALAELEHDGFSSTMKKDSSGNYYTAFNDYFEATDTVKGEKGTYHRSKWSVGKSTDGGATWSIVDSFEYEGVGSFASLIHIDSADRIYVVGYGYLPGDKVFGSADLIVRKSTDGGTTWGTTLTWSE